MTQTIYDDSYTALRGVRFGPIEAPFPSTQNPTFELMCEHAHGTTGLITEFEDGNLYAVTAMYRKGEERGIYCHFSAEECRAQAAAFTKMAAFLEENENV
jgi:hypothetical protein